MSYCKLYPADCREGDGSISVEQLLQMCRHHRQAVANAHVWSTRSVSLQGGEKELREANQRYLGLGKGRKIWTVLQMSILDTVVSIFNPGALIRASCYNSNFLIQEQWTSSRLSPHQLRPNTSSNSSPNRDGRNVRSLKDWRLCPSQVTVSSMFTCYVCTTLHKENKSLETGAW